MTKPKHEFNLIEGTFTGSETTELLSALFLNKLSFHRIKNFSHQERFGKPDIASEKRIQVLEQTLEEVVNFLKHYNQEAEFEINAEIKIKPVNQMAAFHTSISTKETAAEAN